MSVRRDILTYAAADMTGMAIGLLVTPVSTRLLTPEQFGIAGLLTVVWGFISIARYGAMDFALPMFLAKPSNDAEAHRRSVLWSATNVATLSAIVLCAAFATVCASRPSALRLAEATPRELMIFAAGVLPAALVAWYSLVFRYLHRAPAYAGMNLFVRIGAVAFSIPVMFYVAQERRLEVFLAGAAIAGFFAAAWGLWKLQRLIGWPHLRERFSRAIVRDMFRCGIVLIPGAAVYAFSAILDRLMVEYYSGPAEVAVLSLTLSLGAPVVALRTWFALVWDPYLIRLVSTADRRDYHLRMQQAITTLLLTFMPLAVLAAVWGRPVVEFLYPESYYRAAELLPLLVLQTGISALSLIAVATILISRTPRFHPWVYGCGLLTNFGLCLLFVPRWGAYGAVLSTLCSEVVILAGWVFVGRLWQRNLQLNWWGATAACTATGILVAFYPHVLGAPAVDNAVLLRVLVTLAAMGVAGAAAWQSGIWKVILPQRAA